LIIASDWSYDDGGVNRAIMLKHHDTLEGSNVIDNVLIANNIIIGYATCFSTNPYSSSSYYTNLEIKNNIMMDGDSGLINLPNFDDSSSSIEIEDNLFYCRSGRCSNNMFLYDGNNYASLAAFETGESAASSNEYGDSDFVAFVEGDYDNSDYHLASTDTAAMDLAQTLTDFSTDKDGNTRPFGSAWDIGAYEYGGVLPESCTD